MLQTPLYEWHQAAGGRVVDFSGWALPVQYSSQKDEHHAVRTAAGMFDVSHMSVIDLSGGDCNAFLRKLLANDVNRIADGRALYSCMLDDAGGVIDDLIVYRRAANDFRIVVNAATRATDLAWIEAQAAAFDDVSITTRFELALIAVQGPKAESLLAPLLDMALPQGRFSASESGDYFVGRTGYTGEDGFEVMLPADNAVTLWQSLHDAGVVPCGLGARDTLRLEAGMALYGADLDTDHTPLSSGLSWTISLKDQDRQFNGRAVLEAEKAAAGSAHMVGLVLDGRGVLRGHLDVYAGDTLVGVTTSGGYSPTTERSIAIARVSELADHYTVEIRGKRLPATRVKYPFVSQAKATF